MQQPSHRRRLLHVFDYFLEHAKLRLRRTKRQDASHGSANLVVGIESDSGLRPHLAALQLQPEFEEEQLFEDEPQQCRRTRLL